MNRNNTINFDDKSSKPEHKHQQDKKIRIEKGIVAGALVLILVILLVIPEFERYQENKTILAEKKRYHLELPDKMTEESYLKQLKIIGEQLDETRRDLPESLDTVSIYEVVSKMAESTKVGLTSLEFGSAEIEIDDRLGIKIDKDFMESDEKSIAGPDGKLLTTCKFSVVCSGSDETFMAFLNALDQSSPVISVISYEIEKGTAGEKQMRLLLESYGVQETKQNNAVTAGV